MNLPTDSWLRRFHPVPDPVARLVCCPHAGGSASSYFTLSKDLAERARVEVVAVQYTGRQDRRTVPAEPDIQSIAARIAEELSGWADRPLSVFGHSMGATIGYELARLLQASDVPGPVRVIVSGQRSPALQSSDPVAARDEEALVRELSERVGGSPELLGDPDVLAMVLAPLRADYAALHAYRHRPGPLLSCPVTALVGASDPQVGADQAAGWSEVTTGPFDLRVLQGGHFYLETSPEEFTDAVVGLLSDPPPRRAEPTAAH